MSFGTQVSNMKDTHSATEHLSLYFYFKVLSKLSLHLLCNQSRPWAVVFLAQPHKQLWLQTSSTKPARINSFEVFAVDSSCHKHSTDNLPISNV